jgi:hypothetical protein
MVAVHLFVEGGGTGKALRTECRRGFRKLLESAKLSNRVSKISPAGGRQEAYKSFCTAHKTERELKPMLLVDSESRVLTTSPWDHVKHREGDGWDKPKGSKNDDLHLMVQCMEAWIIADRHAVREFYGQLFNESALPPLTAKLEDVSKNDLYAKLYKATKDTKTKGPYRKGAHSFKLLALLDPSLIRSVSQWAERFFRTLEDKR